MAETIKYSIDVLQEEKFRDEIYNQISHEREPKNYLLMYSCTHC